ncbi:hypothetical protein LCGC14_1538650 [marine sediment metagenome]|uniref:Ubiquitin-activating enzyme E1 FCCH domain-containing protein n=1 Tax=marine sediment metagenome TaxID=412755 RepID=A0A0F9JEN6_9ZZZZ
MDGRTDLSKYYNGASKLINALVLPHGGFTKRPGTEYIAKAPNKCNLLSFEFSVSDALVLEFSNLLLRFYKDGDSVYEDDIEIASTTEDDPVLVTTDAAHSLADDEWVYLEDIDTATSLNDKIYQITVTGAGGVTKFTLQDTEGNDIDGTGIGVGGALGSCKRVYQIVSPYTSARAFDIHVTQSADVMYIAHNDVFPKKLSRNDTLDWTIVDVPFTGGPFLTENTTDASLVQFARTGGTAEADYYFPKDTTGTLTATGTGNTPFNVNQVGALWLVKHTRDVNNDTDTFAKDTNVVPTLTTYASGAIKIKGDATVTFEPIATSKMAQLWRKEGNGAWQTYRSFRGATAFSWTEDIDDVYYAMTRSDNTINGTLTAKEIINYGIVKITDFTSTTVVICTVVDPILTNNSGTSATTSMWAEGAWSTYRGFPRTVGFHEDRLWWASSTNDPDKKWSSQSGLYENMAFTIGTDNEAVTATVKDNEVSQIQWMMSRRVMAIGAANREYSFSAQNPEDPITPLDKKSTPQTGFSSGSIQPVMLNDSIFFLQRQGKKLGAMKFDSVTENFIVDDATLLAYGLLDSQPTNMAVQRVPDSIIWVVRTDGVLLSFTYDPKEEVAGWARHITQNSTGVEMPVGFFESVAVIHGSIEDEVWVSVRRVINSVTVRYVERFATRFFDQIDEAMMLDSAKTVSSAFDAQEIVLASDTVRCNNGLCNSSLCGGVPV